MNGRIFAWFTGTLLFLLVAATLAPGLTLAQIACDPCGKCGTVEPPDYDDCKACLYTDDAGATLPDARNDVNWTVIGCINSNPASFTQQLVTFITTIAGGIIFLILLYGGFLFLTASGDPEKISQGKSLIRSGFIALFLIFFAVFILRFVGLDLLQIPGFE